MYAHPDSMEKFESFKVAELKEKLQEVGLDTKGRKKELIERLRSYVETQEGGKATLDVGWGNANL